MEAPELKKKKLKPSKALDFALIIKVTKSALQTKAFQDATIHHVQSYLLEYFSIHSKSPGFPDLIVPAVVHLKSFAKIAQITAFKKKILQTIEQVIYFLMS